MTIRNMFDATVTRYPGRPAQRFYQNGHWITRTYEELNALVIRVAAFVHSCGIQPGRDNVALMMPNCPEWQVIYLALACTGVTVVPFDPKLRENEIRHILQDSHAVAVFAAGKSKAILEAAISGLQNMRLCVFTDAKGECPEAGAPRRLIGYEKALEVSPLTDDAAAWFKEQRPQEDSIASILYTSGTTGTPKGAMLTHRNFETNAAFAQQAIPFSANDDFLVSLPLFHAFSFSFCLITPLYAGSCCSYVRSLKTLHEDLPVLRPTTILAVPLLAEKICAKIKTSFHRSKIATLLLSLGIKGPLRRKVAASLGGRLRLLAIGGAPTDLETLRFLSGLGVPIAEGYGLTECGPLVSFPPMNGIRHGAVGKLLPCMKAKIAAPDASGTGELLVKGPNVMKGYYRNEQASAEAFDAEGYFKTGDLAKIDDDGYLRICGRCKNLIVNREGKNIYPEEIEQAVNRSCHVAQSLALGYRIKGETGEHVGLLVQPTDEAQAAMAASATAEREIKDAILHLCHERLAAYKNPRKLILRPMPFELTSSLKVRRGLYAGTLDE